MLQECGIKMKRCVIENETMLTSHRVNWGSIYSHGITFSYYKDEFGVRIISLLKRNQRSKPSFTGFHLSFLFMHRFISYTFILAFLLLLTDHAYAQRPSSPRGEASTQIGEDWIIVDYSRPILRGRTEIFGSGDEYGQMVTGPAPVWRAGANKSTRFHTETDLMIGGVNVVAGEYSIFVELAQDGWTFILSSHEAKESGREEGDGLWGAYGYTDDKDVVRAPMTVSELDISLDQFTIGFINVTDQGGILVMVWETTMASIPFMIAQ